LENQSKIDVTLQPDLSDLDEVIVVGYGTSKEKPAYPEQFPLWVVKKYKNCQLLMQDRLYKVRAAGVDVTQSGSKPGAAPQVRNSRSKIIQCFQ